LDYNSGPALRAYLESRGLSIRKQWSQNFLINPHAREQLVNALGVENFPAESFPVEKDNTVWEIGSGLGAMTSELLKHGLNVTAFEIDPGFCSILRELFTGSNFSLSLIEGDVLKTWKDARPSSYLFGNLPYATAAVLMGNLIEGRRFFKRMVITVQKEVALRMIAKPGSKDYSSISVLCASCYSSKIIMTLKGQSFYPVPHVDSAAIRFDKLPGATPPPPLFYPLLRALFASRRKTIANNLQYFLADFDTIPGRSHKTIAEAALEKSALRGGDRAENLPAEAFFTLASELEQYVSLER
jgi:16S rRNA (adenine1518-N6/adenine1519-N6)-dimethyltransferase